VTDSLPTPAELAKIGDLKVFDQNHKEYTFKEVVSGDGIERNLIIFVRHFVCGVSHFT
jgi:hypothetical protein